VKGGTVDPPTEQGAVRPSEAIGCRGVALGLTFITRREAFYG